MTIWAAAKLAWQIRKALKKADETTDAHRDALVKRIIEQAQASQNENK